MRAYWRGGINHFLRSATSRAANLVRAWFTHTFRAGARARSETIWFSAACRDYCVSKQHISRRVIIFRGMRRELARSLQFCGENVIKSLSGGARGWCVCIIRRVQEGHGSKVAPPVRRVACTSRIKHTFPFKHLCAEKRMKDFTHPAHSGDLNACKWCDRDY